MYVALLRGINVGGKNIVPMRALADMFTAAGCVKVVTFIQSGNVVFEASERVAARIPDQICARILEDFGCRTPVILRNARELRDVIANNPFVESGGPEDFMHVMFLAGQPAARAVAALDPDRSPPDRFTVRGKEIYLLLPNGAGRSKLTNAWFDSKLKTVSTSRNWRTVNKLLQMAESE
jgi:uncharacterized protein (DUF1697 family)